MKKLMQLDPSKLEYTWRDYYGAVPFIFRLVYYANRKSAFLIMALSILMMPLSGASIYSIKYLTDAFLAREAYGIALGIAVFVGLSVIRVLSQMFHSFANHRLRNEFEVYFQQRYQNHMSKLPFAYLEDQGFETFVEQFRRKRNVPVELPLLIGRVIANFFSLIGAISVSAVYFPWLATILIAASMILQFVLGMRAAKRHWAVVNMESREGRRANYYDWMITQPNNLLVAKAIGLGRSFHGRWKELSRNLLKERVESAQYNERVTVYGELLDTLGLLVGFAMIAIALLGAMPNWIKPIQDAGLFIVFYGAYQRITGSASQLAHHMRWIQQEGQFIPHIHTFFKIPTESEEGVEVEPDQLHIKFVDVWFRYPDMKHDVLRGVNLEFCLGERVAILGRNGAGKSTLLKLLLGAYQPTRGAILINGLDLQTIRPEAWRQTISFLLQDHPEFYDNLEQLVLDGNADRPKDQERFDQALHISGLNELIKKLAKDLPWNSRLAVTERLNEIKIGRHFHMPEDKPAGLSGGERQIVNAARALYRDAALYWLDEPTSAMDSMHEEDFFNRLLSIKDGRTYLFISHRLSLAGRVDRVVYLEDGKVVEDGTAEELLDNKGAFYKAFMLQAEPFIRLAMPHLRYLHIGKNSHTVQ